MKNGNGTTAEKVKTTDAKVSKMHDEKGNGNGINKERLKRYVLLRMELENQFERLERMRANEILPAMKESDGSQRNLFVTDRLANMIVKRLDFQEDMEKKIAEIMEEMEYIETAIDSLTDPMEKEVLRLRYIDGANCRLMAWDDVAVKIYGDNDSKHLLATYRLHGHALQSIEKLTNAEI